jgi:hypothetical protein
MNAIYVSPRWRQQCDSYSRCFAVVRFKNRDLDAPLLRRVMAHGRFYKDRINTNLFRRESCSPPFRITPVRIMLSRCSECRHPLRRHIVVPNPELARWLSLIHGGCLNCAVCADE